MRQLKFIDLFAGVGGFRSGFTQAGMECIGWCEWDKFAQKSYRAMYETEGEWFANDIRTVNGEERVLTTWIDVVAWGDLADACVLESSVVEGDARIGSNNSHMLFVETLLWEAMRA